MFCLIPRGFFGSERKLTGSIVVLAQSPEPNPYGLLGYGQLP